MNIEISYPTTLDKIEDIYDDNIDVFVKLNNGPTYVLVVITPKNYYTLMEKWGLDFVPAAPPHVIVKVLQHDVIEKAIRSFCANDGYFLKKYSEM